MQNWSQNAMFSSFPGPNDNPLDEFGAYVVLYTIVGALVWSIWCLVGFEATILGLEGTLYFRCLVQEWGLWAHKERTSQDNCESCFLNTLVAMIVMSILAIVPFWHDNPPFWKKFGQNSSFRSLLDGAPWPPWPWISEWNILFKPNGCIWNDRNIGHWRIGRRIFSLSTFSGLRHHVWTKWRKKWKSAKTTLF